MDTQIWIYPGITAGLFLLLLAIALRTYKKGSKDRMERPKYRMMNDDDLQTSMETDMPSSHDLLDAEHADGIREDRSRHPPYYFNLLFYGLIVWAILFCAWYLFSGWSSQGEFAQKLKVFQEKNSAALKKPDSP